MPSEKEPMVRATRDVGKKESHSISPNPTSLPFRRRQDSFPLRFQNIFVLSFLPERAWLFAENENGLHNYCTLNYVHKGLLLHLLTEIFIQSSREVSLGGETPYLETFFKSTFSMAMLTNNHP